MSFKDYLIILILVSVYGVSALLADQFGELIGQYLDFGLLGMLVYVLAATLETVVAPISAVWTTLIAKKSAKLPGIAA